MQEIIAVCKPVLAPEVRQSVTDTDLKITSMLVWEAVYCKEADLHLFFVKVKATLQLSIQAQRGGSVIALRIYKFGVKGGGWLKPCQVPLVFNLGTKWGLVVSFRLRPHYFKESIPVARKLLGSRVRPRAGLGVVATIKTFCICRESKYHPSYYVQPVALDTTLMIREKVPVLCKVNESLWVGYL
jgi:hypothetical protein